MNPFWKTFFEEFKDRGRDATPFLITVGVLVPVVLIAETNGMHLTLVLPWVGVVLAAWMLIWLVWAIGSSRKRRRQRWERHELSRDELRVARSKLLRDRNGKGI